MLDAACVFFDQTSWSVLVLESLSCERRAFDEERASVERSAALCVPAPALTTREPDANGLRFYDANAVRTPNNRALEELKIDELWDKWHRQLKITSQGVVHGHGTVAKVRLYDGHTIVAPSGATAGG